MAGHCRSAPHGPVQGQFFSVQAALLSGLTRGGGCNYVSASIRRPFDGSQRSLRSQPRNTDRWSASRNHADLYLFIYLFILASDVNKANSVKAKAKAKASHFKG